MVHNHRAIDFHSQLPTMPTVAGEDRALLRSNPSARIDDGASAGVSLKPRLLLPLLMPCPKSDKPISLTGHSTLMKSCSPNPTGLPFGNIFRARLQMPGPYQALRTPCSHLATFFRLRCRLVVSSNATCVTGTAKTLLKKQEGELVLRGTPGACIEPLDFFRQTLNAR